MNIYSAYLYPNLFNINLLIDFYMPRTSDFVIDVKNINLLNMVGKTNKRVTWRYHYPWKFLIKFKKKLLNNKSLKFSMEVLVWVLRHAHYKIWVTANSISLNFELKKCIRFIVMPFSLPRISSSAVFMRTI